MNNLQHIRSMAEMILQKVDELAGSKPEVKLRKFAVGETVYFLNCAGDEVQGTIVDVHQYDLDRYIVESCGLYKSWMSENRLSKKSNAKPEPKFKVGDHVKHKTSDLKFEVKDVHFVESNGRYCYLDRKDDYSEWWWEEDGLTLTNVEEREWHSGPPPHVGWWNASYTTGVNREMVWRWWDGKNWSLNVFDTESNVAHIGSLSHRIDPRQHLIEWTDYWPENARVPRINPSLHTAANKHVVQYGDTKWVFDPRDGDIWQYWS